MFFFADMRSNNMERLATTAQKHPGLFEPKCNPTLLMAIVGKLALKRLETSRILCRMVDSTVGYYRAQDIRYPFSTSVPRHAATPSFSLVSGFCGHRAATCTCVSPAIPG